jgi:hypothetical protein
MKDAIAQVEENLARAKRRQTYLNSKDPPHDEEQQLMQSAWKELTSLKVVITALEEQQTLIRAKKSSPGKNEIMELEKKVETRRAKEEQLKQERDAYRSKYEELVKEGCVEQLRKKVLDMQHMLLLCEREEKTLHLAR